MRVTVHASGLRLDVDVTIVDPAVPLGEVFNAITGEAAGSTLTVDGWPYRAVDAVGAVPLRNGSLLSDTEPAAALVGAQLTQTAGTRAGRSAALSPGIHDVGRSADDDMTEPLFRVEVHRGAEAVIRPLDNGSIRLDGERLDRDEPRRGRLIRTDREAFRLRPLDETRAPVLPLADGDRIAFRRSPRQLGVDQVDPPTKPELPKEPQQAQPFSWIVALAPIPIGIVAAIFFSPFFLIFLLMSPVLAAARWLESKHRTKKDRLRYDRERREFAADYAAELRAWAATESTRRRDAAPDLSHVGDIGLTKAPGLWARRPDHRDFFHVTVGIGDIDVDDEPIGFEEVDAVAATAARLCDVPITVDLAAESGIGIVGDRDLARSLTAGLLIDAAVGHGPADLSIALLVERVHQLDWDWLKWLPHVEDERGFRRVAMSTEAAVALLTALPLPAGDRRSPDSNGLPTPVPVVVVDGSTFIDGRFTALSVAVRSDAARAIVLADRLEDLPAICSLVVDLGTSTAAPSATMTSMRTGRVDTDLVPILADRDVVAGVARNLAAFRDPDRQTEGSDLPTECDLRSLVGGDFAPDHLAAQWTRGVDQPAGVIGVAQQGPLRLNLVTDGPHALIAGTTGSGKSELLRTLVASMAWGQGPDRLNFVLVDFKGGGAFDACDSLPHTVGIVTDLDEHLAARALRCLKAELRYREQKLRDAGVSDLRDYDVTGDPLPRVVVVVDEFATLAAELPDFMTSLVDVAQRGRSLGIHMILATQRPSGVVDAKIRANTNLRISLRVQDEADSTDVINDKRAADIDRRSPGRGYVRLGASDLTRFQTALVSRASTTAVELPLRVTTFELNDTAVAADESPEPTGPTDLEDFVAAARAANQALDLAEPRVPWPDPLPEEIEASSLWDGTQVPRWSTPLGTADFPDEQRTETYWWSADVGNLAVYGADSTSTSGLLATLLIGLAKGHRPEEAHLYVIDFSGGGGLAGLAELPHVGALVNAQEEERLYRVLDLLEGQLAERGEFARQAGLAKLGPGDGFPLIVLGIANYGGLIGFLEESGKFEFAARFERLVRDGPAVAMYVVATANQDRGIPSRIAGQIESKLVMRLADPNSYAMFGLRIRDMPDLKRGRAIDIRTDTEVQIGYYGRGAAAAAEPTTETAAEPNRGAGGPKSVAVLPTTLTPSGIVEHSRFERGGFRLAIGRRHADLDIAYLELRPGSHLVVTGDSESGKTTALRSIALAARTAEPACQLIVVAATDEWPEAAAEPKLDGIDGSAPTLVLVDGVATIDDERGDVLEQLAGTPGVWLVVADRQEMLQGYAGWLRKVTASRTGILLRPQPDHGDLLRARLPIRTPQLFPTGRGFLVNGSLPDLVQLAETTGSDVTGRGRPTRIGFGRGEVGS